MKDFMKGMAIGILIVEFCYMLVAGLWSLMNSIDWEKILETQIIVLIAMGLGFFVLYIIYKIFDLL